MSGKKKKRWENKRMVKILWNTLISKSDDIKLVLFFEMSKILPIYKKAYLNFVPSFVKSFLQEFKDIFSHEIPSGLSLIKKVFQELVLKLFW